MTIRQTVIQQIEIVANQQKKTLMPLTDNLELLHSGLDSLCIAILVASLDDSLGFDPFSEDGADLPVTLGDFIAMYERANEAKIC